jgi:hypothetical protein
LRPQLTRLRPGRFRLPRDPAAIARAGARPGAVWRRSRAAADRSVSAGARSDGSGARRQPINRRAAMKHGGQHVAVEQHF